ncbi:MAG: hypothetical protein RLN70_06390 [Rhodospirillaceae bacterium]
MSDDRKYETDMPDDDENAATEETFGLQPGPFASTPVDLARLGLNEVAYVRRSIVDNALVWTIYSASGVPLGAAQEFEQAWGAVKQHDLEPVYVH